MSLEWQDNKSELHQCGRDKVKNPYSLGSYPLAGRPQDEPVIPSPDLFNFRTRDRNEPQNVKALPEVAECAAHLELLEVFYVLRQKIIASEDIDKANDIKPNRETKTGFNGDKKTLKDKTLWDRRQVKWTRYIELATLRFLVWRQHLRSWVERTGYGDSQVLTIKRLPPLDVLMVWHSFMLNPSMLAQECRGEALYRLHMPWKLVHRAIKSRDWAFTLTKDDIRTWEHTTGLSADLFEQLSSWTKQPGYGDEPIPFLQNILNRFDRRFSTDENHEPAQFNLSQYDARQPERYKSIAASANIDLAEQLRDAVVRQTAFVDKMNNHMWIRSPAVEGTITRGIDRYSKFLKLLRLYPEKMIVPTLDIDLVWHTHQCRSRDYVLATKALVGRFINHNDNLEKYTLDDGFGDSKKLFRVHFAMEYRVCGCWDCEALLSGLEDAAMDDGENLDMAEIAQRAQDRVSYYRAVELAVRAQKSLPMLHS